MTAPKRRKLTPKQKVLSRWLNAKLVRDGYIAIYGFFDYAIFTDESYTVVLGHGDTPRQAWAASALTVRRKNGC